MATAAGRYGISISVAEFVEEIATTSDVVVSATKVAECYVSCTVISSTEANTYTSLEADTAT